MFTTLSLTLALVNLGFTQDRADEIALEWRFADVLTGMDADTAADVLTTYYVTI